MRKFAKIMAVLLALALAAPCFAKGKVVTKWSMSLTDNGKTVTTYLTFYNDGTLEISATDGVETEVTDVDQYTGDTKKDGTITASDGTTMEIRGDFLVLGGILTFTKVKK